MVLHRPKESAVLSFVLVLFFACVVCSSAVTDGYHLLTHPQVRVPLEPQSIGSGSCRATVGLPYASVYF